MRVRDRVAELVDLSGEATQQMHKGAEMLGAGAETMSKRNADAVTQIERMRANLERQSTDLVATAVRVHNRTKEIEDDLARQTHILAKTSDKVVTDVQDGGRCVAVKMRGN